jgi:hypothetical protein
MTNLSVAAILGCLLVAAYGGWTKCDAEAVDDKPVRNAPEVAKPGSTPHEDPAARALAQQLEAAGAEVRENAATALEAMGPKAGEALAGYIEHNTSASGIRRAATILGNIGKGLAENDTVRQALLSAAGPGKSAGDQWPRLQMRLAAIEALGKINEYRGGILGKESDNSKLVQAKVASCELEKIAENLFDKLANGHRNEPVATPPDADFYAEFKKLRDLEAEVIEISDDVEAAAPLSKTTTEPAPSRLTDLKTLESSVKTIYSGYLEATKMGGLDHSGWAPTTIENKSDWQMRSEAAYGMLTEAKQLKQQLESLYKATSTLKKDRDALTALIVDLAARGEPRSGYKVEPSDSDLITAEFAKALNRIFSKPPAEKPAADAAKKGAAKKDTSKKDATKDDAAKDNTAKKGMAEEE